MEGWIRLHRKLVDNPVVCKDSDYFAVWIYLLINATHKKYNVLFKGKKIILYEGQLITGRKIIAKKFKIDENKVQRILKSFENEHQIEQQASSQNRLITIVNWNAYQSERHQIEQQVNNERTTDEQRVNTNKNIKNNKNDKNIYLFSNKEKNNNVNNYKKPNFLIRTEKIIKEMEKNYGR